VRENRGGKLYSLVYGRPIARHVEFIEKKPLYHFLPGSRSYSIATPGCNFQCPWCQNWEISRADARDDFQGIPYIEPAQIVAAALAEGCQSVCYTYTEPTIFMEYALDTARLAQKEGLRNVFVTNGYQSPEAVAAMCGLIDAANVDLKGFSDEFYRKHCRARLQPVLDAISAMHRGGIHVEVTTLVIPGLNDSEAELRQAASFLAGICPDLVWHVTRFHPDYQVMDIQPTPASTLRRAVQIGHGAGVRFVYAGNVLLPEAKDTACPGCGHVVVRREGLGYTTCYLDGDRCPACGAGLPIVVA